MNRRKFIVGAAAGTAATAIAAPAIAQSNPEIRWRLTSSFPKSLDTIYGAAETVARVVSELTEGKFQLQVFAAGEIVPGLQVLDAVQAGTVEAGHTAMYYYWGKDPTFAFSTAVPFGLNERNQTSWYMQGGGIEAMREFMRSYNVTTFLCGSTGAQMGGWFRREIRTVADMNGLKMRIGGFAGRVMQKLGVVPQQIAGGDIYPALERGTIDAAEWVGPYDDQKLGFNRVAPFYYYPGWWEGGAQLDLIVGIERFNALPRHYKAALDAACHVAHNEMRAKYDQKNPIALRELAAAGTQFRPFTREVLTASLNASWEVYSEVRAQNANFRRVYDSWAGFRENANLWFRFAENTFDNFVFHTPTPAIRG